MWKKALIILSLFAFTVALTAPADHAEAKPRSFSSGKKSFNKTPSQSQDSVSKSSTTNKSSSTAGTANKPGFFSGGSFMKGMMIGGLAGLLFGGMFGSGFFGNMMGFLVNVLALFVLFMVFRAVYDAFKRRRQSNNPPNQRRW
jgi:predicted lipid-binding transport protein (Tim44 family)